MSALQVFDEAGQALSESTTDIGIITSQMDELNILFERWEATVDLPDDATEETILEAYKDSIAKLNKAYGFELVDVAILSPDNPNKDEIRQQFNFEHTHDDFEVRFFVEGSGLFYFHLNEKVYLLLCEKGDLISVPAKIKHWFDMGESPDFKLIRFFPTADGWIAEGSGSDIATHLPVMDAFAA
ncbi:MAG: cupin [SAR86 cluster bacterium]|uniref:Acireductone dioxygenase n=1 Tax=SAR86 cluster bacterium TaxID=2030880 RepID=A0A2A5CH45_9GAMM|nr:MAG: cupin [SAR86 cluster bacterium]